jgi:hypothetical protein
MGQAELEAAPIHSAQQQALALQVLGQGGVREREQLGGTQRLPERHQLQQGPLGSVQVAEASLDQLDQTIRGSERADQAPDPTVVSEGAVIQGAQDELVEVQHIALTANRQLD